MLRILTVILVSVRSKAEQHPDEAAQLITDYVVAADFDKNPVAQLQDGGSHLAQQLFNSDELINKPEQSDSSVSHTKEEEEGPTKRINSDGKILTKPELSPPPYSDLGHPNAMGYYPYGEREHYNTMGYSGQYVDEYDRDVGVVPAAGPAVASQRSVLAIGFITFLLLLTSLQREIMTSMGFTLAQPTVANPSLLGGVTQALGRRRRSLQDTVRN